jgi:hypothetical protein
VPRGCFDAVLCFGFLYHTIDHLLLLRKIARLKPMSLVIDTATTTLPGSIIRSTMKQATMKVPEQSRSGRPRRLSVCIGSGPRAHVAGGGIPCCALLKLGTSRY